MSNNQELHVARLCQICSAQIYNPKAMTLYCYDCSKKQDQSRKLSKAKKRKADQTEKEIKRIAIGVENNKTEKKNLVDVMGFEIPDFKTCCYISVPYSKFYSKNAIYSQARGGHHVFIRAEARKLQEGIIYLIKQIGPKFHKGKVWLSIHVEKPNNLSDAINVIDSIADAVKKGIDVDDRWFSLLKVDWSVVKVNPQIFIGIFQEIESEVFLCSYCGKSKYLSEKSCHKRTCQLCYTFKTQ